MNSRWFPLTLLVLLAGLLFWVVFSWQPRPDEPAGSSMPRSVDFSVQSLAGPVKLSALRGKVVLLYFGYTWCPDICPTSLTLMSMALRQLNPEELAQVQPVFVSVDPERDTLKRLDEYAHYFHPSIIGATATPEVIDRLVQQYGAAYRKVDVESSTQYTVDHTSATYVIDQQGVWVDTLAHGTKPDVLAGSIRRLLATKP